MFYKNGECADSNINPKNYCEFIIKHREIKQCLSTRARYKSTKVQKEE